MTEKETFPLSSNADGGFKLFHLKIGQLCLIDQTPSEQSPKKRLPQSESILEIDTNCVYDDDSVKTDLRASIKTMFRGIIVDESLEKCVVQNVDTSKKLTLKKRRIHPLNQTDSKIIKSKANAQKLVELIPFMLIKAKPVEEISSQSIKKVLKNSMYYCEGIQLNIGKQPSENNYNNNKTFKKCFDA